LLVILLMPKMPKARPGATRLCILLLPMFHCKPNLGEYRTGDRSGPGLWNTIYFSRKWAQYTLIKLHGNCLAHFFSYFLPCVFSLPGKSPDRTAGSGEFRL
jgi:hypothetical protein